MRGRTRSSFTISMPSTMRPGQSRYAIMGSWWSQTESNRRHPACKAGALPTELWPRSGNGAAQESCRRPVAGCVQQGLVGPGRLELPTLRLSGVRSNHLSYGPMAARQPGAWAQARDRTLLRPGPYGRRFEARKRKEKRRRRRPAFDWSSNRPVRAWRNILRKEVIQPQVPLRLPCYDFTPVADPTVVACLPCGLAQRLRVEPTPMV